jgi:hypothetical protein
MGFIHMNGRVYDPQIGRFLSAVPYIQDPYNTQSYNRYSYVINNPLKYTDPTGNFVGIILSVISAVATQAGISAVGAQLLFLLNDVQVIDLLPFLVMLLLAS